MHKLQVGYRLRPYLWGCSLNHPLPQGPSNPGFPMEVGKALTHTPTHPRANPDRRGSWSPLLLERIPTEDCAHGRVLLWLWGEESAPCRHAHTCTLQRIPACLLCFLLGLERPVSLSSDSL